MTEITEGLARQTASPAPPPRAGSGHRLRLPRIPAILSLLPLVFLSFPLAAMVWRSLSPRLLWESFHDPIVIQALVLSFGTSLTSLVISIVIGTPVAYLLARHDFPGRRVLDTILDLPMILPPAVAGLALLMAFGRKGLAGPILESAGITLAFTTTAVVIAQCFVATPFYIRSARAGFEEVDPALEQVARTLGVPDWKVFLRITVPLALPSLLGGAVMSWARALGEFGATIMFAGNFPGRTQTMPLAVYTALEGELGPALTLALVLLIVSFVAIFVMKAGVTRTRGRRRGP